MSSVLLIILIYNRDKKIHITSQTMKTNFTWSTTKRDEIAILYNNYLYRLRREIKTVHQFINALPNGVLVLLLLKVMSL
jgi:hypothetical protein